MPRGLAARLAWVALAAGLSAVCGGCYGSRWDDAGRHPASPGGIDGRWAGTWLSAENGHGGGLRCIVTDVTPRTFKADFQATYAGILSFSYAATMRVTAVDTGTPPAIVYFAGEQDLGWLAGGTYTYQGSVDQRDFICTYRSGSDHGTFLMTRPGGEVARDVDASPNGSVDGTHRSSVQSVPAR